MWVVTMSDQYGADSLYYIILIIIMLALLQDT